MFFSVIKMFSFFDQIFRVVYEKNKGSSDQERQNKALIMSMNYIVLCLVSDLDPSSLLAEWSQASYFISLVPTFSFLKMGIIPC